MSTVMSTQPAISTPTTPSPPVLYRMTVHEYERIGEMLDDPLKKRAIGVARSPAEHSCHFDLRRGIEPRFGWRWGSER
jgi:hypothetical protein